MKRPIKYLPIKLFEFSSQEFFFLKIRIFISSLLYNYIFKMIIDDILYQHYVYNWIVQGYVFIDQRIYSHNKFVFQWERFLKEIAHF